MTRWLLACLSCAALTSSARGEVIVVANRTPQDISFTFSPEPTGSGPDRKFELAAGDAMPIVVAGAGQLRFDSAGQRRSYRAMPLGVYYFGKRTDGTLDMGQISLPIHAKRHDTLRPDTQARPTSAAKPAAGPVVIPVKIFCDEDEIAAPAAWKRRMQARIVEASRIIQKHCFVRFEVVATGDWHSHDAHTDLEVQLAEFERLVDPAPARLAIGFTGQNKLSGRAPHLGGTRGPLNTHLLLREWNRYESEAEKLEVLVHELGHFLGAVHSPEPSTVMRPVLGDRQARSARFRIGFDPLNTLAMCLVGEALQANPAARFWDLDRSTQTALRAIYTEVGRALPDDPSVPQFLHALTIPDSASP